MTAAFSHLDWLQAESIHILREAAVQLPASAAALLETAGMAVEVEELDTVAAPLSGDRWQAPGRGAGVAVRIEDLASASWR
jgi:hypothetical protein